MVASLALMVASLALMIASLALMVASGAQVLLPTFIFPFFTFECWVAAAVDCSVERPGCTLAVSERRSLALGAYAVGCSWEDYGFFLAVHGRYESAEHTHTQCAAVPCSGRAAERTSSTDRSVQGSRAVISG